MINASIFKSYDIRGIYPLELDEETAYRIGGAFVRYTKAKKIAVCRDARLSSPAIFKSLTDGITAQGADVFNLGMFPTELLYFAVGNYDYDAGIMITASHNPKEYNGLKMVKRSGDFIKIIPGEDIAKAVELGDIRTEKKGQIEEKNILNDYLSHVFSFVDSNKLKPFKIVIDASNGVAGNSISKIQDKLPIKIIPLNFEPDGNFPNHAPNPLAEGSGDQIRNEIKNQKADFGFIFDGDADRIFLVDEDGVLVRSDVTILFLAKYFLQKNPGMGIARHVTCSKAIPEFIKKWGGKPIRTKVGFIYIQQGLIENNGIMGGELSGHYCFKDNFYSDSGMIAFLTLLQVISQDGRKVSEMAKEFSPYAKGPEINFEVENKEKIINLIKEKYKDGEQDHLDGVTIEYSDWWFNVRPSNTEPLLRLTIEADTPDLLEQKKKELTAVINKRNIF